VAPVAAKVVEVPEQIATPLAVIVGKGFTVTVTEKVAPAQPLLLGVTTYVAVWLEAVVLVSTPVMLLAPEPVAPPVIPPVTVGTPQE
jgi:hypothetical protein